MATRSVERARSVVVVNRDRVTWAAYLLLGLFAFLETAIGPAMPLLRKDLDLGYTVASLHFTAFAAGGISASLCADRVMRRWGRRVALWGGLAGMVAGASIFALSTFVVGTIFGVYLMGICGTVFLVTNQATLSDLHGELRTIALAESNVAASSAAVAAPLAIGFADSIGIGWQWGILIAIPVFLLLSFSFRAIKLPKTTQVQTQATNQQLPRVYWFVWIAMFLAVSVEWCVAYWGADFLDTVVGLETGRAATAMSVFFAAMVIGRFSGARLAHHYPATHLLIAALIVALIGLPIFWLVSIPMISLAGLFVAGFGIANFYPLTAATATIAAPDLAELAMSRLAISGSSALLVAPFLIGVFSDAVGIRWGFGIVIPFALAALAMTLKIKTTLSPSPSPLPEPPDQSVPTNHQSVTAKDAPPNPRH